MILTEGKGQVRGYGDSKNQNQKITNKNYYKKKEKRIRKNKLIEKKKKLPTAGKGQG